MASTDGAAGTVLFGGFGNLNPNQDTWQYDSVADNWTHPTPFVAPPWRAYSAMAFDSQSRRVILFGGYLGSSGFASDTWAFDPDTETWHEMSPPTAPPARGYHSMEYDRQSDRMILFGGSVGPTMYADTWAYDYEADVWTRQSPNPSPDPASDYAAAYDAEADLVVLYGPSGLWGYDYDTDTWTRAPTESVSGPSPPASIYMTMAYDDSSDRTVLFGGYSNRAHNETWSLDFSSRPLGSPASPATVLWLSIGVGAGVLVATVATLQWRRSRRRGRRG